MPTLTIRKLSDETHRALKVRAAQSGRSTEAEVRLMLEQAVAPTYNLAGALVGIGKKLGGIPVEFARDKRAFKPRGLN
jgi:antitoxin FitA